MKQRKFRELRIQIPKTASDCFLVAVLDCGGMVEIGQAEWTFENWAAVAARMRIASPADQARILAQSMLTANHWVKLHEAWAQRLNDDIAAGRMQRPERYASMCRAEMDRKTGANAEPPTGANPHAATRTTHEQAPTTQRTFEPHAPIDQGRGNDTAEGPFPLASASSAGQPGSQLPEAGADFRDSLTPLADPVKRASPTQTGTMQRIGVADLHKGMGRVLEAVNWSVEQYARWTAALEQHANDPSGQQRLWEVVGITKRTEQTFVVSQWQRRLEQDPELNQRYLLLLANCRASQVQRKG